MAAKKKPAAKSKPAAKKAAASKASASAAKPLASKTSASKAKPKPAPNLNERMEGLQGWMAEIERKQTRMTRIGGGAAGLAVLLSGGALALGIMNKQDASSKDDVDELTEQVNELGASVKSDTEEQLSAISGRIDAVEQQVKTIQQTQTTQTQDIQNLKNAQSAAAAGPGLDTQPVPPVGSDIDGTGNNNNNGAGGTGGTGN